MIKGMEAYQWYRKNKARLIEIKTDNKFYFYRTINRIGNTHLYYRYQVFDVAGDILYESEEEYIADKL